MQALKKLIKKYGSHLLYRKELKKQAYVSLINKISKVNGLPLSNASADIFTYHGEDGIIQFIIKHLPDVSPIFVDIGAGDCIKSNCAVPAVHQNWSGVFIDTDKSQLNIGERYYQRLKKKNVHFKNSFVTPYNVNTLIKEAGYTGKIGLLSIDIDGNDYWIWNAIEVIQPSIVVIEAKVEFGMHSIAVPYSGENHSSHNKMYHGASVEALKKLGLRKGYTLIGAIPYGYNLFFIPANQVKHPFYPVTTETVLQHRKTQRDFYPDSFFQTHQFELV